jgi:hypothetical protein
MKLRFGRKVFGHIYFLLCGLNIIRKLLEQ